MASIFYYSNLLSGSDKSAASLLSYFLCFQYGIVARSYVLLIPLLFGIASIYERKFQKPFLFILLILLLANVSLHGSLMALAIMLGYFHRSDQKKKITQSKAMADTML
ncbi:MAG: hypothetical protein R2728_14335 [Chitinophagales bacterium]